MIINAKLCAIYLDGMQRAKNKRCDVGYAEKEKRMFATTTGHSGSVRIFLQRIETKAGFRGGRGAEWASIVLQLFDG